jgi:hypothetical protein
MFKPAWPSTVDESIPIDRRGLIKELASMLVNPVLAFSQSSLTHLIIMRLNQFMLLSFV